MIVLADNLHNDSIPVVVEREESNRRNLGGRTKILISIWAVGGVLLHLYSIFISYLTPQIHVAMHLLFAVSLAFLLYKPKHEIKSTRIDSIPYYDYFLALLAAIVPFYLIINFEEFIYRSSMPNTLDLFCTFILVILVLEGTRRVMGNVLPIICLVFIAYAFWGYLIPGFIGHRGASISRFAEIQFMTMEGIFGTPTQVCSKMIFMFILFGAFLFVSGAGDILMKIAMAVAGRSTGGPGKVAVVASGLMGMVSGSASANVATTGQFTIPLMKRMGFTPQLAGAIEAVASTGGTLAPPVMGAGAFIMAEILGVSYLTVAKAAIIPAILYYLCTFIIVHYEAKKIGLRGLKQDQLPNFLISLREGFYVIFPVIVLVLLVFTYYPIMRATLFSIIVLIAVSWFKRETRIDFKKIYKAMTDGMFNVVSLALCCASAGIVIGCISLTGLGPKFASTLVFLAGDIKWVALVISMVVTLVLGMGLPATAAYIVGASVTAPALLEFGFPPLGVQMFVFYFSCLAQITPPVAIAAYVGAAIAGSSPLKTAVTSVRLGLVAIVVPFMFIESNTLLMSGAITGILWDSSVSLIGVFGCAVGLAGYFKSHMSIVQRILTIIGGLLLIKPGLMTDIIGFILICFSLGINVIQNRSLLNNKETF